MNDKLLYTRKSIKDGEAFRTRVESNRPDGLKGLGIDIIPRRPVEEEFRQGACPLNCAFCYQQETGRTMTLETYNRIVAEAKKAKLTAVYLLGGEPLQHPDILEIMKIAVDNFEEIILVSNIVRFAQKEFLERFVAEVEPHKVLLVARRHIYRPDGNYTESDRQIHEKIVGRKMICGEYGHSLDVVNRAWNNILKFWPSEKICVQSNPMQPWAQFTPAVYHWALEQGFADCVIEIVRSGTGFQRDYPWQQDSEKLDLSPQEIRDLFGKLAQIDEKFGVPSPPGACKPAWRNPCGLPFNSAHIDPDGNVLACGGMPSPYGNIYSGQSLNEILKSSKKEIFMHPEEWVVGPCNECEIKEYCKFGCRAEAYRGFQQYGVRCYRASDPYCWRHEAGLPPQIFYPQSCVGCPLEDDPTCHLVVD